MSELARPLSEAAERLFAQRCGAELVNAAERGEWPGELWRAVEELGAAKLLVPEPLGGAGGDWRDACALLKRAGEHNVPLPVAETLLASAWLARAGMEIPPGPLAIAFAAGPEDARALRAVPWAARAAALVLVVRQGDAAAVVRLARGEFDAVPGRGLSGEPRDQVSLSDRAAGARAVAEGLSFDDCLAQAALARSAMIAGALRRVLDLSVAFARQRVQFGRPIAQFQAVQHLLAALAEETAAANVMTDAAAKAGGTPWQLACIAAAKTRAGEAAGLGARIAHQVHGAMGITFEHPLHQSTRRLLAWRDEYGAEAFWARRLAACFRARNGASVWSVLSAATSREEDRP